MKTRFVLIAVIALFTSLTTHPLLGQTQLVTLASSDFEINGDGWQGTNSASGSESVTYNLGGATSNSVGYLSISESAGDGFTMYFAAPEKFLGDKHTAYHGLLKFNFKQSATSGLGGAADYVLLGTTNLLLSFTLRAVPGTNWKLFEIPLNESVGWFNVTSNRIATSYDFHVVLKALRKLFIRGEFSSGNYDRSDLDDVLLLGQPSGPLQPILTAASYTGITINGEIGVSYRIEYRDSFSSTNSWRTLTDIILPVGPYLLIDRTSPASSSRMYRTLWLEP